MWGLNSRLDNLQAAFLLHNLRDYSEIVEKRRSLAAVYDESLAGVEQVVCPPGPSDDTDHFDVFQNYEIEARDRDELQAYLKEHQIGTLVQWGGKAVHQIEGLGFSKALPQTEALFERCLMLPLNLSLREEDVRYVVSHIKKFYERG
jgi:dTDP-4-amino-4,6-dideoxygalactose transaminase